MLKECLEKHNSIVKNYRKAADIIKDDVIPDITIRLIRNSSSSVLSEQYNMPTTFELAALIVGDFDKRGNKRRDRSFINRTHVILPSSFIGAAQYIIQNYQDAIAIYAWAGYLDIFITFTLNPMWPEITQHCNQHDLNPCDKPKILSRIFHIKLRKLMRTLKDDKIFGSVKAEVYTIEFQKKDYHMRTSYCGCQIWTK
ncbi:hypothetical protein K1719_041009 [Acacia pycnantha]|nr:hypothetical protein K1719_041009 [Acacia pycnantha]